MKTNTSSRSNWITLIPIKEKSIESIKPSNLNNFNTEINNIENPIKNVN